MRVLHFAVTLLFLGFIFAANVSARQISTNCDNLGRIHGIYRTSCFLWETNDGTLTVSNQQVHNDRARLQDAISATVGGKLIFDEIDYYVNDSLTIFSYRTIEGTGRSSYFVPSNQWASHLSSKIIQTASNKSIFKIGSDIRDVAIRDIALVAGPGTTGTIGILAEGGGTNATAGSSFDFEFSNVTFDALAYGIYVNALDNTETPQNEEGQWQFDNIKLDNALFHWCTTGVYINSSDSGWTMKNVEFFVPAGAALTQSGTKTYGVYLKRSTYTSMNLLIGNGPPVSEGKASALIYVEQHFNLSIQNIVDEGFQNSVYIHGGDQDSPIFLANNYFQSPVTINYSTVVSTANQFYGNGELTASAYANNYSRVFSTGDKFCFENVGCTDATYQTDAYSQVVFSTNQFRTTMSNPLRLGASNFYYDIFRNTTWGTLDFVGNQGGGEDPDPLNGYAGYTFSTPHGTVKINNDGSVTYGSKTYAQLTGNTNLLSAPPNGTVVYCSNCLKTTPCTEDTASPFPGAIAKRLGDAWDCD